MKRIVIVGAMGTGKTTLAQTLASRMNCRAIEVDALHWGPNWQPRQPEELRDLIQPHLAAERWIVDGTYRRLWSQVWPLADTLVWLDYRRSRIYRQLIRRTLRRIVTRETLWNDNREDFYGALIAKDNIFGNVWRGQPRLRRLIPAALEEPAYAHLALVRLHSPQDTQRWLASVSQGGVTDQS